MRNSNSGSY